MTLNRTSLVNEESRLLLDECREALDVLHLTGDPDSLTLQEHFTLINLPLEQQNQLNKKQRFLFNQLQTALLKNLVEQFFTETHAQREVEIKSSWWQKLQFGALVLAGTVFAACEGFDGIAAVLGLAALPGIAVGIAGLVFAAVSVLVFYGFEVAEISKHIGVGLNDARKMIDLYLAEAKEINILCDEMQKRIFSSQSEPELEELSSMLDMLTMKQAHLADHVVPLYEKQLHSKWRKGVQVACALTAGVLFASSGFFAGQAVALFLLGAGAASLNPIAIASGVAVALCALAVYWYVERPGLDKLVSRRLGVDSEKIASLSDKVGARGESKLTRKLADLKSNIGHRGDEIRETADLKQRNWELEQDNQTLRAQVAQKESVRTSAGVKKHRSLSFGSSANSLWQTPPNVVTKEFTPREQHSLI